MSSRDLKLTALFAIEVFNPREVKTSDLAPAAKSFVGNALRVKSLGLFPLIALHIAGRKERFYGAALMKATGSAKPITHGDVNTDSVVTANREIWTEFLHDAEAKSDEGAIAGIKASMQHIQSIRADDTPLSHGIDSWLSAQLVEGWTAFETLTGDLWEAALNCHPAQLSDLKSKGGGGDGKTVPLHLLQKFKYDLSKSMGTVLKEKRSFDKLSEIREYYSEAFHTDGVAVLSALEGQSLDALNQVRNLIVHRSSIVDQRYLDRTRNLAGVPTAAVGSTIVLDGQIVSDLLVPVLKCGVALIDAVDDWIVSH
jgi:hypothetical protein